MPSATKTRSRRRTETYGEIFLAVEGGGRLVIEGDVEYEFWFEILRENEWGDMFESVIHISDAEGTVWEGRAQWRPKEIILQMGALAQYDSGVLFDEAPDEWKAAFETGLLISGCRETLDDRFFRTMLLGEHRYEVQLKHQGPQLDLALLPDNLPDNSPITLNHVLARVSGLYHEGNGYEEIPPFVFRAEYLQGLFSLRYDFDGEYYEETEFVRPVLFRRIDSKVEPQETVRFEPVC